jgi:CRISPR-associated protein (TIGR03984 family)
MSQPVRYTTSNIVGCILSPLDVKACERHLAWLLDHADVGSPNGAAGLFWVLAHCDDGVTWGYYDTDAQSWRFGHQVVPEVSPPIRRETLQELRIFGEPGEVLIWRTVTGLRGRILCETAPLVDCHNESDPLRPSDETRLLRGDRVVAQCEHGFTHVTDQMGAEQVIPMRTTETQLRAGRVRLGVRQYYQQDPETGVVRVAVSRLVNVQVGGSH